MSIDYLALAIAQVRALGEHLVPALHDAHVDAYNDAPDCRVCGETRAVLHGECASCYAEGLERARAEIRDAARMARRF